MCNGLGVSGDTCVCRVAVPGWQAWRGNPLLGVRDLPRPVPEPDLRRLGERAAHRFPGLHDMGLEAPRKVLPCFLLCDCAFLQENS